MRETKRRVKQMEEQARGKETTIAVVDVRDLSPAEASAHIAAKRAELKLCGEPSALIILKHQERRLNHEIN